MSKPFSDPLSDVVRRCPPESPTEQDRTGQNRTTPKPPQAGASVRAARARNGSRRRRDREALAAATAAPIPDGIQAPTELAIERWHFAREHLRSQLPFGSVENWLDPLELLGTLDGRGLVVAGPPTLAAWCRKRYASALNLLIPGGVLICDREENR